MTNSPHDPLTWIGEGVAVIGDDPAVARAAAELAAEPYVVTIVGPRDDRDLWPVVEEALPLATPPGGRVRVIVADSGSPERGFAARTARELDAAVIAPRGDVALVPGGTLFAPDGWLEYAAEGEPRPSGRRVPRPEWEEEVDRLTPDTAGELVVLPIPAGLWVFSPAAGAAMPDPAAGAAMPDLGDLAYSVPMDDGRPVLLIGRPGHPEPSDEAVLALVGELSPALRGRLVLAPYGPATGTPGLAAALARRLELPVDVSIGLPMLSLDGRMVSLAANPSAGEWWETLTTHISFPPHGPAQPIGAVGGVDGLELVDGKIFVLTSDWVAEVVPSGLWVRSAHHETGAEIVRAYPWRPSQLRIFAGVPGAPPDPEMLPLLDALVDRLPAATRRSVEMEPPAAVSAGAAGDALAGVRRAAVLRSSPLVASVSGPPTGGSPDTARDLPVATQSPPARTVAVAVADKQRRTILAGVAVAVVALVGVTGYIASLPTPRAGTGTPPVALDQPATPLPVADRPSGGSGGAVTSGTSIAPSGSPSGPAPSGSSPVAQGPPPAGVPVPAPAGTTAPLNPGSPQPVGPSLPGTSAPAAPPNPPAVPANPSGRNLALDGTATSSSTEGAGAYSAAAAVDGNAATRWSSTFQSDPQWLAVDLGSAWRVSAVRLRWESAYAKAYRVELSADGSTWRTVHSTRQGAGGVVDIAVDQVAARHVRLVATQRSADRYGYSLYELEVR